MTKRPLTLFQGHISSILQNLNATEKISKQCSFRSDLCFAEKGVSAVNAISNDGTRVKDFIDVYFLLGDGNYTIGKLLDNYQAKYKLRNPMHALKSLNYFEEVDLNDWPELLRNKEVSWKDMKRRIDMACQEYIQNTQSSDN